MLIVHACALELSRRPRHVLRGRALPRRRRGLAFAVHDRRRGMLFLRCDTSARAGAAGRFPVHRGGRRMLWPVGLGGGPRGDAALVGLAHGTGRRVLPCARTGCARRRAGTGVTGGQHLCQVLDLAGTLTGSDGLLSEVNSGPRWPVPCFCRETLRLDRRLPGFDLCDRVVAEAARITAAVFLERAPQVADRELRLETFPNARFANLLLQPQQIPNGRDAIDMPETLQRANSSKCEFFVRFHSFG
jgi:hypothetical protein